MEWNEDGPRREHDSSWLVAIMMSLVEPMAGFQYVASKTMPPFPLHPFLLWTTICALALVRQARRAGFSQSILQPLENHLCKTTKTRNCEHTEADHAEHVSTLHTNAYH